MLLTQGSFFSISPKISFQKCEITSSKVPHSIKFSGFIICGNPLFTSGKKNYSTITTSSRWRTPVLLDPTPSSGNCPIDDDDGCTGGGVGIVEFFRGKNIFITGGTGFVGKVFIEKLLRSTPVGKIYVLIRAEDRRDAFDRIDKEIIKSELFKCLREKHGSSYEEFVKEKLVPAVGNICEPNLGMDSDCGRAIMDQVDVIIECAASTTYTDRYDFLLDANVNAPQRLMRFAKTCKNLKLFVHMSTAYVNGKQEGLILEKPLIMGGNGRNKNDDENPITSSFTHRLDIANEMSLAMNLCSKASSETDVTKDLVALAQTRTRFFGWHNAYQLTKSMGEMVLNEIREDIPLLIIRPSIIESTYKEPFPGWIQGNKVADPVIIAYGKGQYPAILADPQVYIDFVPVDLVVNSTIAAIAKHGSSVDEPKLNVYHVASSVMNPLRLYEFFEIIHTYFNSTPLTNSRNISQMRYFDNLNEFSRYTKDIISQRENEKPTVAVGVNGSGRILKRQKLNRALVAYAEQLSKMYEFIGFFKARFDVSNTQKLLMKMSEKEKIEFDIDATNIDWRKYFGATHIPGLKKHVLD